MSNLAVATPPDDDLPSQLGLQHLRSWGSTWQGQINYNNTSPDTSNAGTIEPLDDTDDLSTQAAFERFDAATESLGSFPNRVDWQALATQMDATGDTSWEDDFILRTEDEAWDGMAIDCPDGVCPLSGDDLVFLDAVVDGGVV